MPVVADGAINLVPRARQAKLAVLMLAQRPTATLLRLLREHGVHGMLHKDDDLERGLLSAIPMIADGGFSVSPRISRLLDVQRPLPDELQQRDVDVLQLTADGFQVKEISSHLGLASKTIYRTLQMLREVYDAHSNAQLIDIAHQKKLLDAGDEDDAMTWSGTLPSSGDYKIIVGGTRGNATYKLTVSIK